MDLDMRIADSLRALFEHVAVEIDPENDSRFRPVRGPAVGESFADELEMALYAKTSFDKATGDLSGVPAHLEESA